jgi:threonine/homoserine/homoserine lactone efflux protein
LTDFFSSLASGLPRGTTAGLLPGPLQTVLIQRTLALGWRRSIIGILAPPLSDIPVILLVVVLFRSLPDTIIDLIRIAGGLFLLWLAWGGFKGWRAGQSIGAGDSTAPVDTSSNIRFLWRMLLVSLMGPGPWVFWATVNGPIFTDAIRISPLNGLGFLIGFYVPFMLILAGWIFLFDRLRLLNPRITRALLLVTVVVLALLGLQLIAQGLGIIA